MTVLPDLTSLLTTALPAGAPPGVTDAAAPPFAALVEAAVVPGEPAKADPQLRQPVAADGKLLPLTLLPELTLTAPGEAQPTDAGHEATFAVEEDEQVAADPVATLLPWLVAPSPAPPTAPRFRPAEPASVPPPVAMPQPVATMAVAAGNPAAIAENEPAPALNAERASRAATATAAPLSTDPAASSSLPEAVTITRAILPPALPAATTSPSLPEAKPSAARRQWTEAFPVTAEPATRPASDIALPRSASFSVDKAPMAPLATPAGQSVSTAGPPATTQPVWAPAALQAAAPTMATAVVTGVAAPAPAAQTTAPPATAVAAPVVELTPRTRAPRRDAIISAAAPNAPLHRTEATTLPPDAAPMASLRVARRSEILSDSSVREPLAAAVIAPAPGLTATSSTTAPAVPTPGIDLRQEAGLHRMIDHIEQLRDAAGELAEAGRGTRISLSPDSLGRVEVTVKRDGDGVQVHFAAAESGTRQLLADARPQLTELAESRGVRIERTVIADTATGTGSQPDADPRRQAAPAPQPAVPRTPPRAPSAADEPATDHRIA